MQIDYIEDIITERLRRFKGCGNKTRKEFTNLRGY
jgi:hypothetical protein